MKALEGEIYTMQEIFQENIKYYKGESLSAQDIIEESK